MRRLLLEHLQDHYALYGEFTGVRSARKHIGWYVKALPGGDGIPRPHESIEDCAAQLRAVAEFFDELAAASTACRPEPESRDERTERARPILR